MTKLAHQEVIKFLNLMKKRITDIEEVINIHFNLIKRVILKEKQDKLYRAMKYMRAHLTTNMSRVDVTTNGPPAWRASALYVLNETAPLASSSA